MTRGYRFPTIQSAYTPNSSFADTIANATIAADYSIVSNRCFRT